MIALLMGFGLGKRVAQLVGYVAIPLLIVGALWLALHLYGNSRYNAGVRDTDAKWEEAGRRLEAQARVSAGKADSAAVGRVQIFNDRVAEEKEKLDAAAKDGSSAFDVLFGTDDGVR